MAWVPPRPVPPHPTPAPAPAPYLSLTGDTRLFRYPHGQGMTSTGLRCVKQSWFPRYVTQSPHARHLSTTRGATKRAEVEGSLAWRAVLGGIWDLGFGIWDLGGIFGRLFGRLFGWLF